MVAALAFVPSPPLLLTALGGGPMELRSACQQAISALDDLEIVVVGAATRSGWVTGQVDATPWGAPGPASDCPLPLALAVGATLLGGRPHRLYGVVDDDLPDLEGAGLLVVGDGSARRTEKAPGYLDDRAHGFDESVEHALAAGDPDALAALDADLAAELMVSGGPAWRAAAHAAPGRWQARVHYSGAPFGVGYLVASWTR